MLTEQNKLESRLQRKILADLKNRGAYVFKNIVSTRAGVPDVIACVEGGKFVAFEVKREGKTMSDLQRYNKEQIHKAGGRCYEVDTWDKYLEIIAYL